MAFQFHATDIHYHWHVTVHADTQMIDHYGRVRSQASDREYHWRKSLASSSKKATPVASLFLVVPRKVNSITDKKKNQELTDKVDDLIGIIKLWLKLLETI